MIERWNADAAQFALETQLPEVMMPAMMNRHSALRVRAFMLLCSVVSVAQAPAPQTVRNVVRDYRQQHEVEIVRGYAELLALPNVASDTGNIRANADLISTLLQKRGFTTRLLAVPGSPPVVYGELPAPGARHTILWYAHYDGQPVDKAQWAGDPWTPVLRDGLTTDASKAVALDSL